MLDSLAAFLAYFDNYLIDVKFEASRSIRQAEIGAAKTGAP
jgi:hypothetical protein